MGRESALYVILGMAISLISLAPYFGILAFGERLFGIDPKQAEYYFLRLSAQVLQWLFALVANFLPTSLSYSAKRIAHIANP